VPVLGNPAADHILVEMLDYTCPHCRELHSFIQKALARYGDQLGIAIYHIPLSRKCNPIVQIEQASHAKGCDYARLAYGVWKLSPEHFAEYHDWLIEGEKGPAAYVARNKALELVGEQVLLDKSIEVEANRRISEHSQEVNRMQTGLPVLVFEKGIIKGKPESEEAWYKLLEERLGVTPRNE
jgi:protein-disulfide isomerase